MKRIVLIMIVVLTVGTYTIASAAENILKNPSFEETSSNEPALWSMQSFDKSPGAATFSIREDGGHTGNSYVVIVNHVKNDSRYVQTVKVNADKKYHLLCWAKTEKVSSEGKGANLSILGHLETSKDIKGTSTDWSMLDMYVDAVDDSTISISVGLGAYSNVTTGTAFFDDIAVEEVDSIPTGAIVAKIENSSQNDTNSNTSTTSGNSNLLMGLSLFAFILVLSGLIMVLNARNKLKRKDDTDCDDNLQQETSIEDETEDMEFSMQEHEEDKDSDNGLE